MSQSFTFINFAGNQAGYNVSFVWTEMLPCLIRLHHRVVRLVDIGRFAQGYVRFVCASFWAASTAG
jgi:hypothetical protein